MANKPSPPVNRQPKAGKSSQSGKVGGAIDDKSISSVWLQGADKAKSIADNFGKSVDQILGEFRSTQLTKVDQLFKQASDGAKGLLSGFKSKFAALKSALPIAQAKALIDQGKKFYSVAKQGIAIYKEFEKGNYDAVLSGLSPVLGNNLTEMGSKALGTYKAIKSTNFSNWREVVALASGITGFDFAKELHLNEIENGINALKGLAQKYNVPEVLNAIKERFGKDKNDMANIAKYCGTGARLGQIEMIEASLGLTDPNHIKEVNPDIITNILAMYKFPVGFDGKDLDGQRVRILTLLKKIDPLWDREIIDGITYFKVEPWTRASKDIIKLFQHHDDYGDVLLLAPQYKRISLRDGLRQTYPFYKI